jgi:Tfp pilus assembly protein PilF
LAALAGVEFQRGDAAAAVDLYRRALKADYNQAVWHLGLARALEKTGEFKQAAHEAQIAVRLRPTQEARDLAEELTQRALRAKH